MRPLAKGEVGLAREVDAKIKNKFRFDWLDTVVKVTCKNAGDVEIRLIDSIVKVDIAGKALCNFCNYVINYGSKGKSALIEHVKSVKHITCVDNRKTNYTLGAQFKKPDTPVFPLFNKQIVKQNEKNVDTCEEVTDSRSNSILPKTERLIPLSDRTSNMEAMILGVMAENNIALSAAPKLLQLIKDCSRDPKALSNVSLDRCSAGYKLKYGLSDFFQQSIFKCMRNYPFSLNIDESTSANNKKVLAILVSYFSPVKEQVVVEHLASIELVKVDSSSIFDAVKDLFETNAIPWTNLQSCLLDSCNVMRGSKSGFETRLRECAPHLLDVDWDSCHHIHNAVKKFCEPFQGWVERLFHDLYTDFKWSSESKQILSELCSAFNLKFSVPKRFIPHRWLSAYDVSMSTLRLLDMLYLFYFPFVNDPNNHRADIRTIIQRLQNSKLESRVYQIFELLRQKNKTLTKDGRQRKERLVERLFANKNKTSLILNFYVAALPMLKEYVCQFQKQEPLIHKLHDSQLNITKNFLACFI